jgi:hypothetical protein
MGRLQSTCSWGMKMDCIRKNWKNRENTDMFLFHIGNAMQRGVSRWYSGIEDMAQYWRMWDSEIYLWFSFGPESPEPGTLAQDEKLAQLYQQNAIGVTHN